MYRNIAVLFLLVAAIVSGCKFVEPTEKEAGVAPVPPAPEVAPAPAEAPAQEAAPAPALKQLTNSGAWTASASSQEAQFSAAMAVDGSPTSRWSSEFKDDQWWMVDFGKDEWLGNIVIRWEDAYAKSYRILVSTNSTDWFEVYSQESGVGGTDIIDFVPQWARQVKIECLKRATIWGNSFFEVEFNKPQPPADEASASSGSGDYAPKYAIDGKMNTRWSSTFGDSEWWQVKFAQPRVLAGLKILWETAFAEKYEIQVSKDGQHWQKVYSVAEGDGRTDLVFFKPVEAAYLRIQCLQRGTGWGNSIFEVSFYDESKLPVVTASSTAEGSDPGMVLDGDPASAWHSAGDGAQMVTVQLPETMGLGGMEVAWGADYATAYQVECSTDGQQWQTVYAEKNGNGAKDYLFFPATDARFVRLVCAKSSAGAGYAIQQLEFKSDEEQATPIRAYQAKARDARPGMYLRWLLREQEFWTVVGVMDDDVECLITESGVIEPAKNDFSVMPIVLSDGKLTTWADVKLSQSLEKKYLPMPSVTWTADGWKLEITPVASGPAGKSFAAVRYLFTNTSDKDFNGKLGLEIRPVQVNPIWQHGGMSPIRTAEFTTNYTLDVLRINDRERIVFPTRPTAKGCATLDEGDPVDFFASGSVPPTAKAEEKEGKVGAGVSYDLQVPAGKSQDIVVYYPLHETTPFNAQFAADPVKAFILAQDEQYALWEKTLDAVTIDIPEQRLIDVMKSNFGYVLINRDAPWFKPGSRNYNHAWTRDGALTGVAMLRMGEPEMTKQYILAYTAFVADSGWAPHMILEDGKPVAFNTDPNSGEGQEYDSQGEYVFIVRQYFDYTGDEALLRQVYPKVEKALRFARELRRRRMTDEYRNDVAKVPYYGILPMSNSHEGYYPAKHSYWDDFWVLKGFKDGIYLAGKLGETNDVAWMQAEEKDFRRCLYASIMQVIQRNHMNLIPGCVELADTDPTSTSVAIMACDEADQLPEPYGTNSFNVYWDNFAPRLKPGGEQTFTPYECRNADVFFRIGERDRGLAVLRYFTAESTRPHDWNHFAEVVHAKVRAPSYIGDMPHTWISSDYINAVRSIFAYEKGDSLVVAAGVDPAWLGEGVTVGNLPTQFGALSYTFRKEGGAITLRASGAAVPPAGFVVSLPQRLANMTATVDGQPAPIVDGQLKFGRLPATVTLQ